jgi:FMN phosphatase YigB (HAD superfamily)
VRAVVFDVGETLVNEAGYWGRVARLVGVPRHVMWAALGAAIAAGEHHREAFARLGIERPAAADAVVFGRGELYPDAVPCLARLHADGLLVGVAGNHTEAIARWIENERLPVDVVGSSAGWGVEKPARAFFERIVAEAGCAPGEVAYVGDRVDNDVTPAAAAGLFAVHVRRGPWGYLQRGADRAAARVDSLADLPAVLGARSGHSSVNGRGSR